MLVAWRPRQLPSPQDAPELHAQPKAEGWLMVAMGYEDSYNESDTPKGLAERMAGMRPQEADAAYIHRYVKSEYGSAPSVEWIKQTQLRLIRAKARFSEPAAVDYSKPIPHDAGRPWRPASIMTKEESLRLQKLGNKYKVVKPYESMPWMPAATYGGWEKSIAIERKLIESVSCELGMTPKEILSKSRVKHLVRARAIVVAVLISRGWTRAAIGKKALGGRDHSTVINLLANLDIYARQDPAFQPCLDRHMEIAGGKNA